MDCGSLALLDDLLIAAGTTGKAQVRYIDAKKGKGLFAIRPIKTGEVIIHEPPIAAMQHAHNRIRARTCGRCFRFLGTLDDQLKFVTAALIGTTPELVNELKPLPRVAVDQQAAASAARERMVQSGGEPPYSGRIVDCMNACGEQYCSEGCRMQAWHEHHHLLCVGTVTADHPLVRVPLLTWAVF